MFIKNFFLVLGLCGIPVLAVADDRRRARIEAVSAATEALRSAYTCRIIVGFDLYVNMRNAVVADIRRVYEKSLADDLIRVLDERSTDPELTNGIEEANSSREVKDAACRQIISTAIRAAATRPIQ